MTPDRLTAALSDRYRIERELGAGGMATVYLAEDLKHHRQVALKVLRDDLTASLGKERFLREISIAAGLTHPHILPLHDSGEADGHLFYVMPYVDGPTLRQRLLRTGELPIADAVRILRDIADAMAYAHKRGVVHRDLKPENVMLTDRHALVTDFGVAKALSEATGRNTLTTAGVALGTPSYMSPEQATADPHTDHRSDIYAFGVVAYELLTGRTPFSGGSPQEVLARHVTTAAEPVTAHRASIPPALAALVMKCLEKKPADRWQSAEELIPQLEAVLTPSGGITPHATAPYSAATGAMRNSRKTRTTIVAAAALLVVIALGVAYGRRGSPSSSEPLAASTASAAKPVWLAVLPPQYAGRPEDDWFSDGLADELRGALVKIPGVQVKGSRSSQTFKGTTKTIPEIGRALGVDYLVVSSVRWTPTSAGVGRVHFAPELVDARTEAVKWRAPYDTTVTDLANGQLAIAEHAARDLAGALDLSPAPTRAPTGASPLPKVKPEAYATYLAGRQELNRFTQASQLRSVELFHRAVRLDSTFAKAHAWLALSLSMTSSDTLTWLRAIRSALAFAPDDPDAITARGGWRRYQWDWRGSQADFSRALVTDPNNVWAAWGLIDIEAALGNVERSVELGKSVAVSDPLTAGDLYPLALRRAGRMNEALAAARAGLAVDSLSTANNWWAEVSRVLAWRGDVAGSRAAEERAVGLGRGRQFLEAPALARAGRTTEARAIVSQMRPAALRGEPQSYSMVLAFASLGEADSAFAWLDRLVTRRHDAAYFATSEFLTPLHSDPRWHLYLKRVGLR